MPLVRDLALHNRIRYVGTVRKQRKFIDRDLIGSKGTTSHKMKRGDYMYKWWNGDCDIQMTRFYHYRWQGFTYTRTLI